jgi:hypothetical protein
MRRILRKVAGGTTNVEELGDVSTLADPTVCRSSCDALILFSSNDKRCVLGCQHTHQ